MPENQTQTPAIPEEEMEGQLQEQIGLGDEPREFEDEFGGELTRLREQAQTLESGELPTLGEETSGQMDTQLEAQKGELDMRREREQEDLLLRLYGSGATQSTVAGEAAGRMLFGQEQTHRQLLADDASRRLNARADMADRMMNSLAFQASVAQGQQQTALQAFGLEVTQLESAKDRAAGMLDNLYGRRATIKVAKIGARAQTQSASISAGATRYAADASARATLGAASIGAKAQRYAVNKDFKMKKRGIREDRRQFNADLGFRNTNLSFQDQWQQQDFGLRREELQYQDKWNRAQIKADKRNAMLAFAGGLLSDIALKANVVAIPSAIDKVQQLHGYTWNWMAADRPDVDGGVIAQEVRAVLPEAVEENSEGHLTVKYAAVVGLLIQAVNELIEERG